MSPVKIAHVTAVDESLHYLLLNQLRCIQHAGYEVTGISSPGSSVPTIKAAGIRHIPIPIARAINPSSDLVSLWRLYHVMSRERFTIIHTHNPKPGLLGQLAARMAGVPIVINTLHGFYFHEHMSPKQRHFYMTLEKIAARCSDVILSQNAEDIQTAIREGICSPNKIKHLGNGIDLTQFNPNKILPTTIQQKREELGLSNSTLVIGFVGRLAAKRKGFLDFLAAGRELMQQFCNVRLLIVGDTDYGKPDAVHPSVAREYGIENNCIFLGRQPNEELPLLYSLMNVLVLPSLFEGVPRVLMEAAAMRVPIVATDVKGNREVVAHGQNGLLVPLGDVLALSAAIIEILVDYAKAQRMGEEGRRMALERFDERFVFEKVKAEYARLLQEKGLPLPETHSVVSLSS